MFCKYCGKQIEDDSTFCEFCGRQQPKQRQDVDGGPTRAKKEKRPLAILRIMIIAGLLIAAVLAAVMIVIVPKVNAGLSSDASISDGLKQSESAMQDANAKENSTNSNRSEESSLSASPAAANLIINEIADSALQEVLSEQVDANRDGELSEDELESVRTLKLSRSDVSDISALKQLHNIESLEISECSSLKKADFSYFPLLSSLRATNSGISEADFSNNSNLEELELDDQVVVSGLEATKLREQWQVVSYKQNGYGGYEVEKNDHGDEWQVEYSYNSSNQLTQSKVLDVNGVTTSDYSYDSSGNLSKVMITDEEGNIVGDIRCTYGPQSISLERYSGNHNLLGGNYVTIGENDKISNVKIANSNSTRDYEYSEADGKLAYIRYHDGDRDYVNRFEYSNGYLTMEDDSESPVARDIRYEYDDQNRCIKREVLSADGSHAFDSASFTYSGAGVVECNDVDLERDAHGNVIKRTFKSDSSKRGTCEIAYKRVFTLKNETDVFQPLELGDPALAPIEVLPCTINLMASESSLVRQSGPYVLRRI